MICILEMVFTKIRISGCPVFFLIDFRFASIYNSCRL
jgi:hypothetical protein